MSNTVTNLTVTYPDKLRQVSACPKCGAPIYVDAELGAEVVDTLPTPFFTCWCRMQQNTPTTIPVYVPIVPNSVPWTPTQPSWTICATATSNNVPLG